MLTARVCDPLGPRWLRALLRPLALGPLILCVFLPLALFVEEDAVMARVMLLLGLGLLFLRHGLRVPALVQTAELVPGPAGIEIRRAGFIGQRIAAAEVIAASTARTASGATLAVVRRDAPSRPLLIDVASDGDLDQIRAALRIGHFGFGQVAWPLAGAQLSRAAAVPKAIGWMAAAVAMYVALDEPWFALPFFSLLVPVGFAFLVFFLWRLANPAPRPRVALTRHGLLVAAPVGTITLVPYANVVDVEVAPPHSVVVHTDDKPVTIAMAGALAQERDHLVAQIRSARQRARGEGPAPTGVPASIALLAPSERPDRAWLERLDATAAALSAERPTATRNAYRLPEIDSGDLVKALANPDAPAPVRAAAARVLARIAPEEATIAIARALDGERDEDARALMRVALEEDVEMAARVLEGWKSD